MANYEETPRLTQARKKLEDLKGVNDFYSPYTQQKQQALAQLQSREPFQYDMEKDPLYRQYAQQYTRQGLRAMEDTQGRAAALTGGYGNSYAQTAGQQAYQQYLTGLNNMAPELYQKALERYTAQAQQDMQAYEILSDLEQTDYDRYRDALNAYLQEREYLAGRADAEYNQWADDRDFDYQRERDAIADQRWDLEFALKYLKKGSGSSKKKSGSSSKQPSSGTGVTSGGDAGIGLLPVNSAAITTKTTTTTPRYKKGAPR